MFSGAAFEASFLMSFFVLLIADGFLFFGKFLLNPPRFIHLDFFLLHDWINNVFFGIIECLLKLGQLSVYTFPLRLVFLNSRLVFLRFKAFYLGFDLI